MRTLSISALLFLGACDGDWNLNNNPGSCERQDLPDRAPTAFIVEPQDGDSFAKGSDITFRGVLWDDCGDVAGLTVTWTSSIDGEIEAYKPGDDESWLDVSDLSTGEHVITLDVVDADGTAHTDTIEITIGQ